MWKPWAQVHAVTGVETPRRIFPNVSENWGRFARPPPLKKYFCGCVAQKIANEFSGWVVQCCACAAGPQQNEIILQNLPQNRQKTCPEAPGRSQEHDGSNRWTFCSIFFFEKQTQTYLWFSLILAQKIVKNAIENMVKKRLPSNTTLLNVFLVFQVSRARF